MRDIEGIELTAGLAETARHIRANLDKPIVLGQLAERAGFSRYHFHRVFRAVFGEPAAAYIRRERLQRAATGLRSTDRHVTAIAFEAGYDSPSAFTRAFTEHFGIPPTKFRADESLPIVPEHALPRFRSREMKFRVEEFSPVRLLGVRRTGGYRTSAPAAFGALVGIVRTYGLIESSTRFIGLSYGSPDVFEESALRFDACVSSDAAPVGELRRIEHAGGRHAVSRHVGPYHFIEHIFDRIFDAVVFSGKFELREGPCMEINLNDPGTTEPKELITDICIPIA
jgi:AraC family transcriptional regulator